MREVVCGSDDNDDSDAIYNNKIWFINKIYHYHDGVGFRIG